MNGLFFLLCVFSSCIIAAPLEMVPSAAAHNDKELIWVDQQIKAILPARVGVPEGYIASLHDPMKMKKSQVSPLNSSKLLAPPKLGSNIILAEEPLRLQAIINKTVLISGKWYKTNDIVRNYTLTEIKNNAVLLIDKKEQKLILFLTKQNNNIKITTK
ncbi:hypothetical protein [Sulfuricurvum sp.]|uniref:hypothetical protein n=1 Tax=Sulfuricurvum sp. TaxID=2025608 RepID=UPI00261599DF|nr:hypothetical protein [Sulfuricurvum sp.]MDD2839106.1 hypothetical protein [Sulfuricurvum sp.]MDD3597249.1 hypothetical protein [Sulfuricurvum sp.]